MINLGLSVDHDSSNENVINLETTKLFPTDSFSNRHIGPNESEIAQMLEALGISSLDDLIDKTVPGTIRLKNHLKLPPALDESAALAQLKAIASKNQVYRSFIGMGYYNCITPPVI
ncbi:MAG: glycine dehydrogenase (aminomethyl-transferring), partial [Xenococcus sp. (in: cyanobacteria)]